jgi:hypothetical protein
MSKIRRWAHRDDVFGDTYRMNVFECAYESVGKGVMIEPIHGYHLHWVDDEFGLEEKILGV